MCLHKCIHYLKRVHAYDDPVPICVRGTQTVKNDFQLLVGGPTPNKAIFKVLVAPPAYFILMVPVCSQVI